MRGSKPRWTGEELRLLRQYARRLEREPNLTGKRAARELVEEREELRRRYPDRDWPDQQRSVNAVHRALSVRTGGFGPDRMPFRWTEAELAVLNQYVRALCAGGYRNVYSAARACRAELLERREVRGWAENLPVRRTFCAVTSKLRKEVARFGKLPASVWSPVEDRILRRYTRMLMRGRYADGKEAARDCCRALEKAWRERPYAASRRSMLSVQTRIRLLARKFGRKVHVYWSRSEQRVVDSCVRALARGEFRSRRDCLHALRDRLASLARKHAGAGRTGFRRSERALTQRINKRARELGCRRIFHPWARAELKILDQCARMVLAGRLPSAQQAVPILSSRLASLARRYPESKWLLNNRTSETLRKKLSERLHELRVRA
jgi:hypothetical protein